MKFTVKGLVVAVLTLLLACEKEKPVYDQVMDIHDEVMPKMDELYRLKKGIQDSIARTPDMAEDQKVEFQETILLLDSANKAMMVWMQEFNPPEDDQSDEFKQYMERELVRVKQMRDVVLSALEKGKSKN